MGKAQPGTQGSLAAASVKPSVVLAAHPETHAQLGSSFMQLDCVPSPG